MEVPMNETKNKGNQLHTPAIGIFLLSLGLIFLMERVFSFFSFAKLWPLFLLIPVAVMIFVWIQDRSKATSVVFPVVFLTFFAMYFFWLNFTNWYHVEDTWPNFLIGPGLAFLALYITSKRWGFLVPTLLLLGLGTIFYSELLQNTLTISILFIVIGLIMIIKPILSMKKAKINELNEEQK
jgi:hypothetical protein